MKQPMINTTEAAEILPGWSSGQLSEPCRLGVFRSAHQLVSGGRWYLKRAEAEAWVPILQQDAGSLHRACQLARRGLPYAVPEYDGVPPAVMLPSPEEISLVTAPSEPQDGIGSIGEPSPEFRVDRPPLPEIKVLSGGSTVGDDIGPFLWDLTQFPYNSRAKSTDPFELSIRLYPNVRGKHFGTTTLFVLVNGKTVSVDRSSRMWQNVGSDDHLAGLLFALTKFTRYWALRQLDAAKPTPLEAIWDFAEWLDGQQTGVQFQLAKLPVEAT